VRVVAVRAVVVAPILYRTLPTMLSDAPHDEVTSLTVYRKVHAMSHEVHC
jgi:hypothetical protein